MLILGDENHPQWPREVQKPRKSPRERFLEVAPKRTQRVLDGLRLLGRCANRTTYRSEKVEIKKIFDSIRRELDRVEARFDDDEPTTFRL